MSSSIYSSFAEKYAVVQREDYGGTITGLIDCLHELHAKGFVFRGQSNALWPIVSSAQRAYVEYLNASSLCPGRTSSEYLKFLQNLLNFAKSEHVLMPKVSWTCFGRKCLYDHEIWGWLQHYSYPTPFVDFSRDPYVALFMATWHQSTKRSTPGMFSIYAMDGNFKCNRNEVMRLERFLENERIRLKGICESEGELPTPKRNDLSNDEMFSFKSWMDASCITVHKDMTLKPWDANLGKERMASQNGLFVYLKSHDISLEQYLKQQEGMNHDKEGEGCILEKIRCFDIPVSLAPCVLEVCRRNGYTEETLGLLNQTNDICLKSVYSRFREINEY